MRIRMMSLAAFAAAVLFVTAPLSVIGLGRGEAPTGATSVPVVDQTPVQTPKTLQEAQLSFRDVAKKVLPTVVEIDVTEQIQQTQANPFFNFGNPNRNQTPRQVQGLGSGIIVQRSGNTVYVLTNHHVVDGANKIRVKLDDQRIYDGKVVGSDTRRDLAVVSFETKDAVSVATLGDSSQLQVGDLVLAVGNPLGYENSVTMGIVSALGRPGPDSSSTSYTDYIQTDAAINQGNSGGALVDTNGDVIGINTWIAAPTGTNVGLGFAIPINTAKSVLGDLMKGQQVQYGWLGVQIGDIPNRDAYAGFGRDLKVEGVAGAHVFSVYKGSPAEKAGILPGDYIVRFNGVDIRNADGLTQVVGGLAAGKSADVELIRYGERVKLSVKLGSRDPNDNVAQPQNLWPGMTVLDITDAARQQYNINSGLSGVIVGYLSDGNTPAAVAGLRPGDVITSIDGKSVKNMLDYYKILNDRSQKDVNFKVNRAGTEITIGISR